MKKMISYSEGLELVLKHTPDPASCMLPINRCLGHRLFSSVLSPSTSPPFDQSAMDGYAFCFEDMAENSRLQVKGIVPAGEGKGQRINRGECVRIFTGAPLPAGADTVVIQEKTEIVSGDLYIHDQVIQKGANVRLKGSHVSQGDQIGAPGDLLTAPVMAFFASLGVGSVQVYSEPRIAIIVTGDELVPPGNPLKSGQVYECNAVALSAAFSSVLAQPLISVFYAKDQLDDITQKLQLALKECDLVVLTGGVSAGDFDFVVPALESIHADIIFHKLKQKPGKPVCFATVSDKMIFGLPGNPASVLTCFYTLVVPAVSKWARGKAIVPVKLPSLGLIKRKPGLTQFLKADATANGVVVLADQESYKLNSFAVANALVKLPEDVSEIQPGHEVEVLLLPL